MTDSNSGITSAEAQELGIFLIPMPVIIDGEVCYEGQNLSQAEFYESLTGGKDVTTSQASPGDLLDMWDEILENGYDDLVYIPMSSGLSSGCETAKGLAQDYDGKVSVADNHRISVTMRDSVMHAVDLAKSGYSASEIKANLEDDAYQSTIYIMVDTLEFLKKGGRVTAAGAALGAVLNIKPILTIQGGKLDAFSKVRGVKKAKNKIIEALLEDWKTRFEGIAMERLSIGAAGSALTPEEASEWKNAIAEAFPGAHVYYNPLSFSIATHTGPGAYGAAITILK